MNYGATPEEWKHFAYTLGLESELLPVVSDPTKVIAKKSNLKKRGKVPSKLNLKDEISGFVGWPKVIASDLNILVWEKRQYGLCIQTRNLLAFDIDCEDRRISDIAREVLRQVLRSRQSRGNTGTGGAEALGDGRFYYRSRPNSNRCLLPVARVGTFPFPKMVLDLFQAVPSSVDAQGIEGGEPGSTRKPCGAIEILGDGNQFVACASHYTDGVASGSRYEWRDSDNDTLELPGRFPAMDESTAYVFLASLINALEAAGFYVEPVGSAKRRIDRIQGSLLDAYPSVGSDGAYHIDLRAQAQESQQDAGRATTGMERNDGFVPWEDETVAGDNGQVEAGQRLHASAARAEGQSATDAAQRANTNGTDPRISAASRTRTDIGSASHGQGQSSTDSDEQIYPGSEASHRGQRRADSESRGHSARNGAEGSGHDEQLLPRRTPNPDNRGGNGLVSTANGDSSGLASVDKSASARANRGASATRGSDGGSGSGKTVDRGMRDDPLAARIRESKYWRCDTGPGYGDKGELTLWCPNKAEHTSDNGPSETVYFIASSEHPRGFFKCMHAHCAGLTFDDFLVRMEMTDFVVDFSDEAEDLTELAKEGGGEKVITPPPSATKNTESASVQGTPSLDAGLERNKQYKYVSTISNLKKALSGSNFYYPLAYCTFRCTVMILVKGEWIPFEDEYYTECRNKMELKQFEYIKKDDLKDVIRLVASHNKIDTAKLWLNALTWDGVDRITGFFRNWFGGAELNTPRGVYESEVARYMWTALAGRTLQPGVQADMVPLLIGEGGARKSSAVRALVPESRQFGNVKISQDADTIARKLQGVRVAELGELRGFAKTDSQDIKDFISNPIDSWIPKFKEYPKEVERRCLFVGTTDQQQVLYDTANNFRRWLPVKVKSIDVDSIIRQREQLWAQGAHEFLLSGVAFEKAERLAIPFLEEHKEEDPWVPVIRDWLGDKEEVELGVVMIGALGFSHISSKRGDQLRVGKILRSMGFESKVVWRNEKSTRMWVK